MKTISPKQLITIIMLIEQKIQENITLAPLTTFKIGGPAKFFIEVKTKEDLIGSIEWAKENKENFFILAGGSNILINDKGVCGLVVKMDNNDLKVKGERIECGAGARLAAAASLAIGQSLTGFEWSIGIPGATVGGAIKGNAEAFGAAISDIIETVEVFNAKKLKFKILSNRDCKFGYRASVFKERDEYIIWSAILKLKKERSDVIQNFVKQSIDFRRQKYPKLPSAGSVFKNIPIKIIEQQNSVLAEEVKQKSVSPLENVGAGLIIDMLGLKGKTIGGAKISLEHANHIVNTGKATAGDVAMLISYIKQQVRDKFGVQLQEEVRYFGF